MKIFFSLLFIPILSVHVSAQDIIVKNDKTEIKSKVIELSDDVIKYKKFERPDGPLYSLYKKEVFMILYADGTKEYMHEKLNTALHKEPSSAHLPSINKTTGNTDSINLEKIDNWVNSVAANDKFNALDYEFNKKLYKHWYLGLSAYQSFTQDPKTGGLFPYIAYKMPVDYDKKFYLWANGGYNYSWINAYYVGNEKIPSVASGGFLWEVGADYYFSDGFGITVYSPQAKGLWFGFVIKSKKLF